MECTWDQALLHNGDQLPTELLQIIRGGSNEHYLEAITRASLNARLTYIIFAHCENIFPHICATLRAHGSLPATIATLGRIIPFAPYLIPYAEHLLSQEKHDFGSSMNRHDDLIYLLGLFRIYAANPRLFRKHVKGEEITALLSSSSRPIVYLAIRILQIYLSGADCWFEEMIKQYLGEDTPESNMDGQWDDKIIDYRFLTLWEEERFERMLNLMAEVQSQRGQSAANSFRIIPENLFNRSTALVGGILLPRLLDSAPESASASPTLIQTGSVSNNLHNIASGLRTSQPLLLAGLAGSGKTLLVRNIAHKLGKLNKMVTLHLNEQSDAKLLIGIYTTGNTPGSFVWKPGVLTTAVQEGRWVFIEDLDRAPNEIISTLLPLIEKGGLFIPNRKQTIYAAQGFKIIATVRSVINHRGDETEPLKHMLGARHWMTVKVSMPPVDEQRQIIDQLYPSLADLMPQFMAVFQRLQGSRQRAIQIGQGRTGVLRPTSSRDLLTWCGRVHKILEPRNTFTSTDIDSIFLEAVDCFIGASPDGPARTGMAALIAEELRIDPQRRDYLLAEREVKYELSKDHINVGRYSIPRAQQSRKASIHQSTFSTNPHTSRMLERVAAATLNHEPLLLVGETGVGKTTAIQHLASHLGKKLVPFNLSQQSEAGDLLGGFKPVSARSLVVPMKDEFDDLFSASFSPIKNQQFLELLGKQMAKSNWKAVCKLWRQALKMVGQERSKLSTSRQGEAPSKKRKVEKRPLNAARWDAFASKVTELEQRLSAGDKAFAFSFVEGNIVKAARNGDWVLLDEINLALPDTLESIADLFDRRGPSLLLAEAGNIERIEAHPEFRIFAAMNPATDVGKTDLPPGIRSRFTELFVDSPDKDPKSLQSIVRSYLRHEAASDQAVPADVSMLYQKIIGLAQQHKLVDGAGQRPHFSLRTLTRTLSYAKYITPLCSLRRALHEGFQMSFMTFLDVESASLVRPLLEHHLFGKRTNVRPELRKPLRKPQDGHHHVQGFPDSKHWVRQGALDIEEQPMYILTPFIRNNLENLIRASSTRQFPVLVQGPTSSGKTSMIEYLAKRTGHKFVRINNHEHTDLQEYMGTYISGTDGRLQFQEGILVRALREGHWIVLDELNLAPTDVLEALNRLLDDNRELLIPETQEVIRPHESFMLFATQNPAGLYGGRKQLSRAFRNRFLELHFDDIPVEELQDILHRRTQLPESRCKRIVSVYRELSVLRQEDRLFEQRSFATLRDLFRWALRPSDTIEQLASNGLMLLAERVRKISERATLKAIIEKVMSMNGPRVRIAESFLYGQDRGEIAHYAQSIAHGGVVWTKAMRRLYVLVSCAIRNNEPVLLVGETGCGKTAVCQMLADAFGKELHTINAHQNTETGDLIGAQRPVRNRAVIEAALRHQLLSSPLLQSLETAGTHPTASLLDLYDRATSSLEMSEQNLRSHSTAHLEIQGLRTRWKALFEWVDGSLVQAMKSGAFFLLDEISLADDSVLERMNSVLEPQRSILLAEKGTLDSHVTATPTFQLFATMNPGGDYGKRELSPALRNRFTEIWVPPLDDVEDLTCIVEAKLSAHTKQHAHSIVAFAQWFKTRYNTTASSSLSIRDVLAWVDFIHSFPSGNIDMAVVHGAALVYIDTLGANPAGLMSMSDRNLAQERSLCLDELSRQLEIDASAIYFTLPSIHILHDKLTIGPFALQRERLTNTNTTAFSFEPPTTKTNAMRVGRALQLSKPLLLEGSPGVGKTALVIAMAELLGIPLTRVNLSEQTDLIDLFGSDVPAIGEVTGTFIWCDAAFLSAMKKGEWVLLDEMNLASQSVLEGLNACLDHRGEVFIPELGQTFTRHPDFRLFAAQNPHHQGSGRKGLPASFVNRFTVVFADAYRSEDLSLICRQSFPTLDPLLIDSAVKFVEQLERETTDFKRVGTDGGPWEFNLRDLTRWLALASSDQGYLQSGTDRDFIDMLFSQRFRSASDREFVHGLLPSRSRESDSISDLFTSLSPQVLQLGLGLLRRNVDLTPASPLVPRRTCKGDQMRIAQSLMLCVQQRWPVILTGSSGAGKTAHIERLAAAVGQSLLTIAMNAETDTVDLLGSFEQADPQRLEKQAAELLQLRLESCIRSSLKDHSSIAARAMNTLSQCEPNLALDSKKVSDVISILNEHGDEQVEAIMSGVQQNKQPVQKSPFEWIDGTLIDALRDGKWLVLDNANLAGPVVLDRLNSLLEPDGILATNEVSSSDGTVTNIRPHPDFRIFLTTDSRFGELSRAMRNRAVELYVPSGDGQALSSRTDHFSVESSLRRFRQAKAMYPATTSDQVSESKVAILLDHMSVADFPLLRSFERQLTSGLYDDLSTAFRSFRDAIDIRLRISQIGRDVDGVHKTVTSQMQAPADFASVQTLHPLNNQALLQSSAQSHSHIYYSLALAFDFNPKFELISQAAKHMQSDPRLVSRLHRLEQPLREKASQAVSPGHGSSILRILNTIPTTMHQWLQEYNTWSLGSTEDVMIGRRTPIQLLQVRVIMGQLHALLANFSETAALDSQDLSYMLAYVSVARHLARTHDPRIMPSLFGRLSELNKALGSFHAYLGSTRGRACTAIWSALKVPNPATLEQLAGLLRFESLVNRLDEFCCRFDLPLDFMVDTRCSTARTLDLAISGRDDIRQLCHKFQVVMDSMRSSESPSTAVPHFYQAFGSIHKHLAILGMASDSTLSSADTMKLEMLSMRKIKRGIYYASLVSGSNVQKQFRLLGPSIAASSDEQDAFDNDHYFTVPLLRQLKTTDNVSLARIELLTTEVATLGKIISSQAQVMVDDELDPRDSALEALFLHVLHALCNAAEDSDLQQLAHQILSLMEENTDSPVMTNTTQAFSRLSVSNTSSMQWLSEQVHIVAIYLRTSSSHRKIKLYRAAEAWAAFARACVHMYISDIPYDPASAPILKRIVHRRHCEELGLQARNLKAFRLVVTGEANTVRSRLFQDVIEALGPEPPAVDVYRPDVSQMADLQSDLDGLTRTVLQAPDARDKHACRLPLGDTAIANVIRSRERLVNLYRAYDDLTSPVVGFIDCILIAQQLATSASRMDNRRDDVSSLLGEIIPFVGATPTTWLREETFINFEFEELSQAQELCWLSAVATRASCRPLTQGSTELRHRIQQWFQRQHARWRKELEKGQRELTAKSSLYKYKGQPGDDLEPTQENLDELFPAGEVCSSQNTSQQQRPQQQASVIASLHGAIYASGKDARPGFRQLISHWLDVAADAPSTSLVHDHIPAVILALGDLNDTMSTFDRQEPDYNMYTNANIKEARNLSDLVDKTTRHFRTLSEAWPEHATPIEVLRSCEQLLEVSHQAPLSQFLPLVENIHGTINEWQKITSKEFSASKIYETFTDLIVSWRRLELSTWDRLFHREWQQCQQDAASWWYVAYETIVAAFTAINTPQSDNEPHAEDLVRTLDAFLTSSAIGEFSARLGILRSCLADLTMRAIDEPHLNPVISALHHLVTYYSYFQRRASEMLASGRSNLEKEVKNVIQVASWKDRNISTLRQSAQSSHKRLLRLVRKYRKLLAEPVAAILQEGMPIPNDKIHQPACQNSVQSMHSNSDQHLDMSTLRAWNERPDRFLNVFDTAQLLVSKMERIRQAFDLPQQLLAFSSGLRESMLELQKATPTILTDKNESVVKHLKTRKRRLLADVLKHLRHMGLKSSLSKQTLAKQASHTTIFINLPYFDECNMIQGCSEAQHAFYRLVGVMLKVRETSQKHSEDLTLAEVGRCASFLESVLQSSIAQHSTLALSIAKFGALQDIRRQLNNFALCSSPRTAKDIGDQRMTRITHVSSLERILQLCHETILVQGKLSTNDYTQVVKLLGDRLVELTQLRTELEGEPQLPPSIAADEDIQLRTQLDAFINGLQSEINTAMWQYPETSPALSQLLKWTEISTTAAPSPQSNGFAIIGVDSWLQELFAALDMVLGSVQDAEISATAKLTGTDEQGWLVTQQQLLDRQLEALNISTITRKMSQLLSSLQHVALEQEGTLSRISLACHTLEPVFDSYCTTTRSLIDTSCDFLAQLSSTGSFLAEAFLNLIKQGFCSPSSKSDDDATKKGEIESGTGLGEGEGGEDISQDIGDEEDISEAAQEAKGRSQDGELEDEKDAVDMADEEMEGEIGEESAKIDEKEEEDAGDEGHDKEIDEEPGEVDASGPSAVDEKTWNEPHHGDESEREVYGGKGTANEAELKASEGSGANIDGDDQLENVGEDEVQQTELDQPDSEIVNQQDREGLDEHTEEEKSLDLPEDINVGGNKSAQSDISDVDSLADDVSDGIDSSAMSIADENEKEGEPANDTDDARIQEQTDMSASEPADEQQQNESDENMSDMLMQESQEPQEDERPTASAGDGLDSMEDGSNDHVMQRQTTEHAHERQHEEQNDMGNGPGIDRRQQKEQSNEKDGLGKDRPKDDGGKESEAHSGMERTDQGQPFKQLGDVLQQWYDEHRKIEDAPTSQDESINGPKDFADAQFEHIPDENAAADTQALGTGSVHEQPTPLDRDKALSVNNSEDSVGSPPDVMPENHQKEGENDSKAGEVRMEPGETLDQSAQDSFIGRPQNNDGDVEMADEIFPEYDQNQGSNEQTIYHPALDEGASEQLPLEEARELWVRYEESTRSLALALAEQLRLILQPTKATKMRGDFRTGKRLNIKRIIPYIASSYKRDKIWMRRSVPSKRSYQVMLAIDDSKSMAESDSRDLAFQTLALVARSMTQLEVGDLSVLGFGEDVKVAHDFATPFTTEAGPDIFRKLTFAQNHTNVRKMLTESIELFGSARLKASGSSSDLWQLQLIVSDGICQDHSSIRQLVRRAHEERILVVFVVIDAAARVASAEGEKKQSILDLQAAEFVKDSSGDMKLQMTKYLDTFPFRYYLIVRDISELPGVLAGALRQWFAEVVETAA